MTYEKWRARAERAFRALGWQLIGRGINSTVMGKDTRAVKISNGWDKWEDYVLWATRIGYAGHFAPKVYRCNRSKHGLIAVMERLDMSVCETGSAMLIRECNRLGRYLSHDLENYCPGLARFILDVRAAGFADDISARNIMWHRGRLVLVDPALKYTDRQPGKWWAVGSNILPWKPHEIFEHPQQQDADGSRAIREYQ